MSLHRYVIEQITPPCCLAALANPSQPGCFNALKQKGFKTQFTVPIFFFSFLFDIFLNWFSMSPTTEVFDWLPN